MAKESENRKESLVRSLQAIGAVLGIAQKQMDQTRGMVAVALKRVMSLLEDGGYAEDSDEYKELLYLTHLVGGCSELYSGVDGVLTAAVIRCLPSELPEEDAVNGDDTENDE